MSHFSCIAVVRAAALATAGLTPEVIRAGGDGVTQKINDLVEPLMAPYHEFECTGLLDQYVVEVDKTEEAREAFQKSTTTMLRCPDGRLIEAYGDEAMNIVYRDPTPDEEKAYKPMLGTGCGSGLSWTSRDWGDGRGYRAKVRELPEGFSEEEVPTSEVQSFAQYACDYFGLAVLHEGDTPDLTEYADNGGHKGGYVLVKPTNGRRVQLDDTDGPVDDVEVLKVVDRTNPNKYLWFDNNGICVAGTEGEETLPFLRENPARRGQFLLDDEAGLVSLLQRLHPQTQQGTQDAGTAEALASESEIRGPSRGLRDPVEIAGWTVCDLPPRTPWSPHLGHRPLSCEREGQRIVVHGVQHGSRSVQGQPDGAPSSGGLSGPFTRRLVGGSKWDWWVIGGRWEGHFTDRSGNERDFILKGDWPVEEEFAKHAERIGRYYDDLHASFTAEDRENYKTFTQLRDELGVREKPADFPADERFDPLDHVREAYNEQPLVKKAKEAKRFDATPKELADQWDKGSIISGWGDGVDDWLKPKENVVASRVWGYIGSYAMVDAEGWHAKGEMGWFGMSDDDEEKDWPTEALNRVRSLDDQDLLVMVDCHI